MRSARTENAFARPCARAHLREALGHKLTSSARPRFDPKFDFRLTSERATPRARGGAFAL